MTPINTILYGDVREKLKEIPDALVDCVVTSPPYWGLRDYKLPNLIWGENNCEHDWNLKDFQTGQAHWNSGGQEIPYENRMIHNGQTRKMGFCLKCSAWRGSLGLEPTPELYVQHLVEVFREVRRVLRPDATLFLNLGDSYAGSAQGWGHGKQYAGPKQSTNRGSLNQPLTEDKIGFERPPGYISSRQPNGLKPKDLVGIPWRVAFALQADGWWLRSDIIWSKPNPMPESVTDRPTKSHEYIFLLSKSASYYFDKEAVREQRKTFENRQDGVVRDRLFEYDSKQLQLRKERNHNWDGRKDGTVTGKGEIHQTGTRTGANLKRAYKDVDFDIFGRNIRSVWHIPTQPFKGAHFATFPEKLIEPCIKAGCPKDGVVLDPFLGSGTTAVVAKKLGRNWIGIELNPDYVKMAEKRIANTMGLLI